MIKNRILAFLLLVVGGFLAYSFLSLASSPEGKKGFTLGLDLRGGSQLVYVADTSSLPEGEVDSSMDALRDLIERRINIFGVSEPEVRTEHSLATGENRLIVELPGVTNIDQAVAMIGETPVLEFKIPNPSFDVSKYPNIQEDIASGKVSLQDFYKEAYLPTTLTGKYLSRADVQFDPSTAEPFVSLTWNEEGAKMFEELTANNVGRTIAIFLDGFPISEPVVNEKISGGQAIISGQFTPEEAKTLAGRMSSGALPVSISLASTSTVGATLGDDAVDTGVKAGLAGLLLVAIFMIMYYRLPGLVGSIALVFYSLIMLAIFRWVPVTLSAAGVAGFIISIGLAIDANVLIFERTKEELRKGNNIHNSLNEGFKRAWASIRDSNISTIISMAVLFWFSTSLIKGFALTFGLGTIVSMISAIFVTKTFLLSLPLFDDKKVKVLFGVK